MMRSQDTGVAPVWRATGDGAYVIPAGWRCIGFYAESAGSVAFTSNGAQITPSIPAGSSIAAQVDSFEAGGDAEGVFALMVKG